MALVLRLGAIGALIGALAGAGSGAGLRGGGGGGELNKSPGGLDAKLRSGGGGDSPKTGNPDEHADGARLETTGTCWGGDAEHDVEHRLGATGAAFGGGDEEVDGDARLGAIGGCKRGIAGTTGDADAIRDLRLGAIGARGAGGMVSPGCDSGEEIA